MPTQNQYYGNIGLVVVTLYTSHGDTIFSLYWYHKLGMVSPWATLPWVKSRYSDTLNSAGHPLVIHNLKAIVSEVILFYSGHTATNPKHVAQYKSTVLCRFFLVLINYVV